MSENSRVVWSEGMFLRPQHFQQHDRFIETFVSGRCRALRSFDWGFCDIRLDQRLLAVGKVALAECAGVFSDGTPFNLPADDPLPLPLDIPEGVLNKVVYLVLPLRRSDNSEIDSDQYPDKLARYHLAERDVRDHTSGTDGEFPVQVGCLRTQLVLDNHERSGYTDLAVARILEVKADKTVILDADFFPAAINCRASEPLSRFLRELHGLIHTRAEALAGRVVEAGRGGVAEIADFMLLQVVNRYELPLSHVIETGSLHPEECYQLLLGLAGELSTFYRPGKRPVEYPPYRHHDLQSCFIPLMEDLRQLLSMVLEQNAIQIPLSKPKFGVYAARRPDLTLLENAVFVLAVNAQVPPETLRNQFPPQVKIGPVEDIQQLVRAALPGISIHPLPVAPRQIPFHAGFSYFELNKISELWKKMASSGGFAIHIGGNFPGLELEFWAIKKG